MSASWHTDCPAPCQLVLLQSLDCAAHAKHLHPIVPHMQVGRATERDSVNLLGAIGANANVPEPVPTRRLSGWEFISWKAGSLPVSSKVRSSSLQAPRRVPERRGMCCR